MANEIKNPTFNGATLPPEYKEITEAYNNAYNASLQQFTGGKRNWLTGIAIGTLNFPIIGTVIGWAVGRYQNSDGYKKHIRGAEAQGSDAALYAAEKLGNVPDKYMEKITWQKAKDAKVNELGMMRGGHESLWGTIAGALIFIPIVGTIIGYRISASTDASHNNAGNAAGDAAVRDASSRRSSSSVSTKSETKSVEHVKNLEAQRAKGEELQKSSGGKKF